MLVATGRIYKGKWHASHAHLDADDGKGYLLSIDDDGKPQQENIERYLEADLLDEFGFSEWVGPEPHGLGKHNTGTVKDVFTADETVELLQRLDGDESDQPWLTVCSFLNPHDDSMFGVIALAQGLRYHPSTVPHIEQAPTHEEDLSTKPACQQSMVDLWGTILAPQPWIETHLKFYYQLQATVDEQITRVLDALRGERARTRTRSWSSPRITATCRARTTGCTRSGTSPTRRRCMCRSSCPVRFCPAALASSTCRRATPT